MRCSQRSADVDTEVEGDAAQTARIALADGAELPLPATEECLLGAVHLAEDHGGHAEGVQLQVIASEGGAAGAQEPDVGVADHAEVLTALLSLVDRDREDDFVNVIGNLGEVQDDLLVVALALAGEVVAGVDDAVVRSLEVVEVHEPFVGRALAIGRERDGAGIEVEFDTSRQILPAPTKADCDDREAADQVEILSTLAEADVATGERVRGTAHESEPFIQTGVEGSTLYIITYNLGCCHHPIRFTCYSA